MQDPIYVTRAFLPPRAEFDALVDRVYESRILTNKGPIHNELEETLRERFDVPFLQLMANGTLALQLAIRALGITGKIITTPYSYVATTSAILWEGCEPIFVDIDPVTCCIDPDLIEAAITPDTQAILATHVYGIPCDVEAIEIIAKRHGLKVIYDAAHAFDVDYKGRSILNWGDASTLSFHATKLFHTVEGGAVILRDKDADQRLGLLRSFGHIGDDHFSLGMNAKMSEVHAAMGMAVLPHMEAIILERKELTERYLNALSNHVQCIERKKDVSYNFAYFPIVVKNVAQRERCMAGAAEKGIHCRRYFYPSLNKLPYVDQVEMPFSEGLADRVICLPLFNGLAPSDADRIIDVINGNLE
ncbi:MAG: DegT/DnrJ/EryC1/StrS family aminotransferase [Flavobacteriales bacterium]|nr:DegT/DnrJ/EryC1/StrS family aminotransferase [Flavobacteriales bacterium]